MDPRITQDIHLADTCCRFFNQSELAEYFGVDPGTLHPCVLREGDEPGPEKFLIPDAYTLRGLPLFSRDRVYALIAITPRLQKWRLRALERQDVTPSE